MKATTQPGASRTTRPRRSEKLRREQEGYEMNYTTTSRELKARLTRAIKDGLPDWVQVHIECRMEYAKRKWEASRDKAQAKEDRDHWYSKAVNVLLGLHDLLGDFSRRAAAPAVPEPSPQPESAA